jgi:4-deoxy-L-threo-5-hexosulose-uronate ketol-isomerase
MDKRYSVNPAHFQRMTTEEIRREFLIEGLFRPGEVHFTYSHVDRMVALGAQPEGEPLPLERGMDVWASFGAERFLDRRELGIFDIGGPGAVFADGIEYPMGARDCLYLPMGTKDVSFASRNADDPAKFYMVSAPDTRGTRRSLLKSRTRQSARSARSRRATSASSTSSFIHPSSRPASSRWA